MSIGTTSQLQAAIAADKSCQIKAELYDFYLTSDVATWEAKQSFVGNGQCVPLVQQATDAPLTALWRKGPKVKGNTAIPVGTAIATFDATDHYPNKPTGNHAAIFVGFSGQADGIIVVDQWKGKENPSAPSRRTIHYRNGVGSASNDGDQFSVVVSAKVIKQP